MQPGTQPTVDTAFYASLPRRYVGAGLLFTDEDGRVLLVEPTYKPYWEVPGGLVELGETPPEAARRECLEELGLPLEPGRLLTVDHQHQEGRGDSTMYIYDGGALTAEQIARIVLPPDELRSWQFCPADHLEEHTRSRPFGKWSHSRDRCAVTEVAFGDWCRVATMAVVFVEKRCLLGPIVASRLGSRRVITSASAAIRCASQTSHSAGRLARAPTSWSFILPGRLKLHTRGSTAVLAAIRCAVAEVAVGTDAWWRQ